MPELPEVETTRSGIEPHIKNQNISRVEIHNHSMRWPIPKDLPKLANRRKIQSVDRRGKYLLIKLSNGTIIIHLGMSGSLRISTAEKPLRKHDHFVLSLASGKQLRLYDPRRFGAVLWWGADLNEHPLLSSLGPEALEDLFTAAYLHNTCSNRKVSIKQHIMNSKVVVGAGNIYASEALFRAGINPKRKAGSVSLSRCEKLVTAIKSVLTESIRQGGTTLKDFLRENGEPGYFKQQLKVYDRANEPCPECGNSIKQIVLGQRSTFYCTLCQR